MEETQELFKLVEWLEICYSLSLNQKVEENVKLMKKKQVWKNYEFVTEDTLDLIREKTEEEN